MTIKISDKLKNLNKKDYELLTLTVRCLLPDWFGGSFMLVGGTSASSVKPHVLKLRAGLLILHKLFGSPKSQSVVYRFITTNIKPSTGKDVKIKHTLPLASTAQTLDGVRSFLDVAEVNPRKHGIKLTIHKPKVLADIDYLKAIYRSVIKSSDEDHQKVFRTALIRLDYSVVKKQKEIIIDTAAPVVADVELLKCYDKSNPYLASRCLK